MDPESFGGENFQKYRWCKRAAVYRHSRSIQIFCCVPRCESIGFAQHKAAGKRALVKGMFLNSCWKFWFDQSNCTILQNTPMFYLCMELSQGHTFKPIMCHHMPHHTRSYPIAPGEGLDQWMAHETGEIAAVPGILVHTGPSKLFFCAVSGCAAFCRKWRLGTVSLWLGPLGL